jgi:anti-sigma factor RsiW
MDSSDSNTLSEDEIHAFVDGQVSPTSLADLRRRLAQDPVAQGTVHQWQQQREALRGMHLPVLDEVCPAPMVASVQQLTASQQDVDQWWRWGGLAASIMLAFGIGWFSSTMWRTTGQSQASSLAQVKAQATQDFVRQASFAHGVYSPEVRHPVEVTAADQAHLVQWLSRRVGRTLKVPNLTAQGYELVGGRLLPGELGARAQFMFQDAAGNRITLYLGAVDKAPGGTDTRETSFNFAADGPTPSFYWIDQGFGYALAGAVPRDVLLKLAQSVYRQL